MATSGIITGRMTVSEIVVAAMQELGLLAGGENPTGEELALAIRQLNWMLKSWAQADGLNLWREEQGSAVFGVLQSSATLDPNCLDIVEARVVVSPPSTLLQDDNLYLVDG